MRHREQAGYLGCGQGQANGAGGAVVHFAGEFDLPLVLVDEAAADGETQAGAPFLGGEERREQGFQVLRRDALAGVLDGEDQVISLDRGAYGDHPAPGHGLQGILKEIEEHLTHLAGIEGKRGNFLRRLEDKFYPLFL